MREREKLKMSKTTVELTCIECGGKFEVVKYGLKTERDIEGYKRWATEHNAAICPNCVTKTRREKTTAQRHTDANSGLPAITGGSQKQQDWAISLRQKFIDECERQFAEDIELARIMTRMGRETDILDEVDKQRATLNYILNPKTDARWWINNRAAPLGNPIEHILAECAREAQL